MELLLKDCKWISGVRVFFWCLMIASGLLFGDSPQPISAGTLYGITSCCPNEFAHIDLNTWTVRPVSVVGDESFGFLAGSSAMDSGGHRFFLDRIHNSEPYTNHIITIDTRSGAVMESPPMSRGFMKLGFDPDVGLFGITACCPNEVVSIDPTTWILTPISIVGDASYSISGSPAVDPRAHRFFVDRIRHSQPDTDHIIAIDTRTGAVIEGLALSHGFLYFGLIPGFDDVPTTHWAFNEIEAIDAAGITGGCSADPPLFCSDAPITRGQVAVFLAKSLGFSYGRCRGRFIDVPVGHSFCGFVESLFYEGIIEGCNSATGGLFCPDEPVTRGQMAVLIETALGNHPDSCTGRFADVPIGHPYCEFIERLAQDGITRGCTDTTYCPDDPVTRAQAAVFLLRAPDPLAP